MKFLAIYLIIAATASCILDRTILHEVDPVFTPLYTEYMSMVNAICRPEQYNTPNKTRIGFGTLKFPAIGMCYTGPGYYSIVIDRNFFTNHNDDNKLSLMFHELTHCVLEVSRHSKNPDSYMYDTINKNLTSDTIRQQLVVYLLNKCG